MGGGWEVVMIVVMVIFLAAVVVGAVGLVRWNAGGHRHDAAPSESSAMAILKERFAKGEITEEEFRQRAEVLRRTK